MVGPRQPSRPVLGVTLDSPEGRVLKVEGAMAKHGLLHWVFVAGDNEERNSFLGLARCGPR